jgi:eukaryotic-like serine/threonine-protein kinase
MPALPDLSTARRVTCAAGEAFGGRLHVTSVPGAPRRGDVLPPRYRDPVRLAGGGMGDVYRATDRELDRTVAIKLLAGRYAADVEPRARFMREALAAARLSAGPHTVTIFDVGEWDGRPYLVMEYLPGGSLEQRLRDTGPPPLEQTLAWLAQAAAALDFAHAHGVIHRDVKPANLLLDLEDNLHVADFGVAFAAGLTQLTQTGALIGTAGYLAPEQASGVTATAAADQYALAVVAFELLTGGRPFQADAPSAEATAHITAPIPSVFERNPRLAPGLDHVFTRALAKKPEERFTTCGAFAAAVHAASERSRSSPPLDAAAATVVLGASSERRQRRRLATRLPRILVGLALLVAAAAGGALAATLTGADARTDVQTTTETRTAAAPPAQTVTTAQTITTAQTVTVTAVTNGADLVQQAQGLVEAGNYQAALPLLQQAAQMLNGSGTATEGTADYSLAFTLAQLGSCDSALPLLDRAQAILGQQPQIDQLRAVCTGPPGHQPGHGHGDQSG